MNIHHLELFYYVAKHGGIAAAVRNMPYGIQQPAVSGQIARLEEALGAKLFNRRPFSLLPAGVELFEFIKPFFDDVEKVAGRIRGAVQQLRIAAPSIVLHDYVPELLQRVRQRFPIFRLQLHEAARGDAERLLQAGEIDLAITVIDSKRRPEIHSRPLLELPLILLVNKKAPPHDRETIMEPGQNRRDANHFSARRCGAHTFPARSRAVWRGMVSGDRSDLHPVNRTLCWQRVRGRSSCCHARFQTAARITRDPIARLSTGRCRRGLGRKTISDRATISRRSRNRSKRCKAQHKIRLVVA